MDSARHAESQTRISTRVKLFAYLMNSAALTISASSIFASTTTETFRVAEIKQHRIAGLLCETLVLERGSQRYTVSVEGQYSSNRYGRTEFVRAGDQIALSGRSRPEQGTIRREDIRKVH